MKHLLLTTIAAVLVVGCGPSEAERALVGAAEEGNIEAVKQHLAAGTDVNAKDEDGDTALHVVINSIHFDIVDLLIAEGADVNVKDEFGETPLDLAFVKRSSGTIEFLLKHGGKHGAIHGAIRGRNIEVVKEFLAAGTDVNAKDKRGYTPLHWAETKEIVELLIDNGADVNAKADNGQTPLDMDDGEIADLLRKHGAK